MLFTDIILIPDVSYTELGTERELELWEPQLTSDLKELAEQETPALWK